MCHLSGAFVICHHESVNATRGRPWQTTRCPSSPAPRSSTPTATPRCATEKRNEILYQWKTDEHLLRRNEFIGNLYNEFMDKMDAPTLLRVMMANFILEGVHFYSGFMFFYNLARNGKIPGSAQEIRYINRDENTHLWLFRSMILELK